MEGQPGNNRGERDLAGKAAFNHIRLSKKRVRKAAKGNPHSKKKRRAQSGPCAIGARLVEGGWTTVKRTSISRKTFTTRKPGKKLRKGNSGKAK